MVFDHPNYRTFLKTALAERAEQREGYSLRAFSERIGLSNSFLSQVFNGKKSLSVELAFKIAVKLNLTELETQYLCLLVQLEQEKDAEFRDELSKRLAALNPKRKSYDLSADLFKVISDWYHFAILELTYLPGFTLSAESASKSLEISKIEAEVAIERLERVELLERDKKGRYRKTHGYVLVQSQIPNGAQKKNHEQILKKAVSALHSDTPQQRVSATDILPLDSRFIPEVERLSVEFSSAVMKLSEKSTVKDRVYALSVHFFALSKNERKAKS